MTLQEIKEQLQIDLEQADSVFEKNLLKAEYDHKIKLLGLKDEIQAIDIKKPGDSDFECIGCGS
jgi:hypothetical protein